MVNSILNTILNPKDDGIIRIIPEPWTQIDAIFDSIQSNDFDVVVRVYLPQSKKNAIISYPKDSEEGITLSRKLNNDFKGKEIAMLFTDIEGKRVIIREIR